MQGGTGGFTEYDGRTVNANEVYNYQGIPYIALITFSGVYPPSESYWATLRGPAGSDGSDGTQGAPGAGKRAPVPSGILTTPRQFGV